VNDELLTPHEVHERLTRVASDVTVTVALDAAGGDNAPDEVVKGALAVAGERLRVLLVGPQERLRSLPGVAVNQFVEIVHAPDLIGSNDEPTKAVRSKPDSSLVMAARLVADGKADACVSAGNTGAVVVAGLLHVRRMKGVLRPAICQLMPAVPLPVVLLDVGANAEVRPEHLRQFAVMGQVFAAEVVGLPDPQVGLLSIGEEPTKGTPVVIEAHRVLSEDPAINFYGNVEGRDIMARVVDVIVTDGFSGNIALKVTEGTARVVLQEIRNAVTGSWRAKVGALIMAPDLRRIRSALDPEDYGGSYLLGLNAPVVIAHGNSRARGIGNAVKTASRAVTSGLLHKIAERLAAAEAGVGAEAAASETTASEVESPS
jgi:glycerol-3-phosphate acyltransferase PlsX